MSKIIPTIWFQTDAREVAKVYLKIFKNSWIIISSELKDPDGAPVYVVSIELNGMEVLLMSTRTPFILNESFSFTINCKDQEEIDYYWNALIADGGAPVMCGWLKDKFGLSWQVVPDVLDEMMQDTDKARQERVFNVVLNSVKLDFKSLTDAYKGE